MTKKHYEMIARIIAQGREEANKDNRFSHGGQTALGLLSARLAKEFEKDNPRFDSAKFLAACGIDQ